jgi:putative hemolysin
MKRAAVPMLVVLALGLAACAETQGANAAGTADYDTLSRASKDCAAKGGKFVLKDGGDSQYIQDYECKGT